MTKRALSSIISVRRDLLHGQPLVDNATVLLARDASRQVGLAQSPVLLKCTFCSGLEGGWGRGHEEMGEDRWGSCRAVSPGCLACCSLSRRGLLFHVGYSHVRRWA